MKLTGTSILGAFFIGLLLLTASAAQAWELQTIENMPAHCDQYDWLREGNCPDGGRHDDGRQGEHTYVSGHMGGAGAAGASNGGGTDGGGPEGGGNGGGGGGGGGESPGGPGNSDGDGGPQGKGKGGGCGCSAGNSSSGNGGNSGGGGGSPGNSP